MSLSSYCRNCGRPNGTTAEMSANHCNDCEETRKQAMQAFTDQAKEEKREVNETDILYAGRQALIQRAHHPRQTFINPREFTRAEMERK